MGRGEGVRGWGGTGRGVRVLGVEEAAPCSPEVLPARALLETEMVAKAGPVAGGAGQVGASSSRCPAQTRTRSVA